jgi:hypothetical protein
VRAAAGRTRPRLRRSPRERAQRAGRPSGCRQERAGDLCGQCHRWASHRCGSRKSTCALIRQCRRRGARGSCGGRVAGDSRRGAPALPPSPRFRGGGVVLVRGCLRRAAWARSFGGKGECTRCGTRGEGQTRRARGTIRALPRRGQSWARVGRGSASRGRHAGRPRLRVGQSREGAAGSAAHEKYV